MKLSLRSSRRLKKRRTQHNQPLRGSASSPVSYWDIQCLDMKQFFNVAIAYTGTNFGTNLALLCKGGDKFGVKKGDSL